METEIELQQKFQTMLLEQFNLKKLKNPRFSLRAFAKAIKIPAPALSEILNGKRRVSRKLIANAAERLMLDPQTRENLFTYSRRDPQVLTSSLQLTADQFQLISEWFHFAILSLAETKGFDSNSEWIARRLGITQTQVNQALERLLRLELLTRDRRGQLRPTGISYSSPDHVFNVSLRKSHFQNLELAKQSLERDELNLRDFTSMTMAIDPCLLEEAKIKIRKFRNDICRFLESGKKKEVYKLNINLIPISIKEM